MCLKAYQMPKLFTAVCNTHKQDVTTLQSYHSSKRFIFRYVHVCDWSIQQFARSAGQLHSVVRVGTAADRGMNFVRLLVLIGLYGVSNTGATCCNGVDRLTNQDYQKCQNCKQKTAMLASSTTRHGALSEEVKHRETEIERVCFFQLYPIN